MSEPTLSERHLLDYWQVLLRRRRLVVLFGASVASAVLALSLIADPEYRAAALLKIDPKAPVILDVGMSENAAGQWGQQIEAYYQTQYRIMESRPVLEEAIRRLREERGVDDFDGLPNPVAFLDGLLTIAPEPATQLVAVRVEYHDAEKAALFANTIAQAYIDDKLERSLEDSRNAMGFLSEQLDVYRSRRVASSEEVHRFQYEHAFPSADADSHVTIGTLRAVQERWSQVHAARIAAESAYEGLVDVRRTRGLMAVATHLGENDPVLEGLLTRYREVEHERDGLASQVRAGHPDMVRVTAQLTGIEEQIDDQVSRQIDARRAELELLRADEQTLDEELQRTQQAVRDLGDTFVTLDLLKSEADRNAQFFRDLDIRATEVALSQYLQASNVKFVEEAVAPLRPVAPKPLQNTLAALLVGLIGGAALAFLLDYLDLNIKGREDVERGLGVAFLGMVPRVPPDQVQGLEGPMSEQVFVMARPRSVVAEALRTLRTTLFFGIGRQVGVRLLVTSSVPQEGKSFVAANLAAVIAMGNHRVLIIDGDMRRSTMHVLYKLPNLRGLSEVLQGQCQPDEVIQKTGLPNLDLMSAGRAYDEAGHSVDVNKLRALLDDLARQYDVLVIDSPPLRPVSDAAVFASLADAAVFVVEAGRTRLALAGEAIRVLKQAAPPILGAILNKVDTGPTAAGSYYYHHYYGYDSYYGRDKEEGGDPKREAG